MLTVHSTAISFVGVALTVLAGAVLLVWWVAHLAAARRHAARGPADVAAARRARTLPAAHGGRLRRRRHRRLPGHRPAPLRRAGLGARARRSCADSYNLANTTPNMLYDVVLGGVLSATFIPVFVDRLANKSEREAFESISAVAHRLGRRARRRPRWPRWSRRPSSSTP